jgi:putative transposase
VKNQRLVSQNPTREEQMEGFHGWSERGYLPHRDEPGLTQFVTFRLADSFPAELRQEWEMLFKIEDDRERRTQLEAWLDLGHGSCELKDEHVASAVAGALRHFDGQRYALRAFTIMPNHVHVLFHVTTEPMAKVVQSWKRFTANRANEILGRKGTFWQEDYWDTYMRNAEHEERTLRYLWSNPVKAGFVKDWKAWPWTYLAAEE